MTKKEQQIINAFFVGMIKNKKIRFVPAQRFDKKAKKGLLLAVLPLKDIFKGWKKLRIAVEGKKSGRPSAK